MSPSSLMDEASYPLKTEYGTVPNTEDTEDLIVVFFRPSRFNGFKVDPCSNISKREIILCCTCNKTTKTLLLGNKCAKFTELKLCTAGTESFILRRPVDNEHSGVY